MASVQWWKQYLWFAPVLPKMPLEFDFLFFFVSCTVVRVQSCQLVIASLLVP